MRKGSTVPLEVRKKISLAKIGRPGHKHTPEEIQKLRSAKLGPKNPNYGKHPSIETRRLLSLSRTGKKNYQWGKPLTPETRAKLSASQAGAKNHNFGKPRDDNTVRKILLSCRRRPNKAEKLLDKLLCQHFPGEWRFVGDGQVIIGGLCPDFININGRKAVIELFGSFWHSEKNLKRLSSPDRQWKCSERGRVVHYKNYGFDCLVVWECELRDEQLLLAKLRGANHVYDIHILDLRALPKDKGAP